MGGTRGRPERMKVAESEVLIWLSVVNKGIEEAKQLFNRLEMQD